MSPAETARNGVAGVDAQPALLVHPDRVADDLGVAG